MFQDLSERLNDVFQKLKGKGVLTEENIKEALREVRRVLLEADVNFRVAKQFIKDVEVRAVGQEVLKSLTPSQHFIKVVREQLTELMGANLAELHLDGNPAIIMMVGLQGSGKTTTCGKLALQLRRQQKKPLLVACDVYRPAAIEQLKVLGKQLNFSVFSLDGEKDVVKIAHQAQRYAKENQHDVMIVDTAGRLHVDENMMQELEQLQAQISPGEILYVADAMTGQDAVNVAKEFHQRLAFTGVILTKMDGDARGGAALSIKAVTQVPIKYVATGEKADALEKFHPDRFASRILGMGDVFSLIEKAEEAFDKEQAIALEKKLRKESFTFEDFLTQLRQMKQMGPLDQLLGMVPGMNKHMKSLKFDDNVLGRTEAIICSMTPEERLKPKLLNGSRRKRIALGSGASIQEVNKLIKQFQEMQKLMKRLTGKKPAGLGKIRLPF